MKDKILEIIKNNPKSYSRIIKNTPELKEWVEANTLSQDSHWVKHIYSAVYQVSDRCANGNLKKLSRWSEGLIGCGPASKCKCTRISIANSVHKTKSKYTEDDHASINERRQMTMVQKYGVAYNSQRPEIREKLSIPKIPTYVSKLLENKEWLNTEYNEKGRTAVDISNELGVYYSTVLEYCRKHEFEIRQRSQYSLTEVEICNYIESLGVKCESSNWSILDGKEIDIFVPSKNIGIEVNGLYWHSYHPDLNKPENQRRHLEKTEIASNNSVSLIHITDWEWTHKKSIIKSMLQSKMGLNSKVYARNTTIKELTVLESKTFFNLYHLQGFIGAKYHYGLFYNDELLLAISVGESRFNKTYKYELLRLATKSGYTVVGGASKLIKYIHKKVQAPIISYCDRDKSNGTVYKSMGFRLTHITEPGYFWTNGNDVLSRYQCQKHKLSTLLENFDPEKSESENMFMNKYRRFWNCGNFVFVMD